MAAKILGMTFWGGVSEGPWTEVGTWSSRRRALLLLGAGTLALNLVLDGILGWGLVQSRARHDRNAETTVTNLSEVLDQALRRELREIDLTLQSVLDEWARFEATGKRDTKALQAFLEVHTSRLPGILGLRVVDGSGMVVFATGEAPNTGVSVADRDHFRAVRDDPRSGLVIADPIKGRVSNRWVLIVARGFRRGDGSFGGQVHASIPLDGLAQMFSRVDLGPHGVVSLRSRDSILARYPAEVRKRSVIGLRLPFPALEAVMNSGVDTATLRVTSSTDGVRRTLAINRVGDLPLWVVAGMAQEDYLSPWRGEVRQALVFAACFGAISLLVAWQAFQGWKQNQLRLNEELVRESEKQLKDAQALAHVGTWIQDLESGRCYCSDEVFRIFGLEPQSASPDGAWLAACAHPEDRDTLVRQLAAFGHASRKEVLQYRICRPDGMVRWVHLEGQLERGLEGGSPRVVAFLHDITETRRLEEERLGLHRHALQAQKLESLGVLTGGIAHDFNNLLTIIIGNLEIGLQKAGAAAPQASNLGRALEASRRAAGLTQQMLAYAGKGVFKRQNVELNGLIQETAVLLRTTVPRSIGLEIRPSPDPLWVVGDPVQLQQVVMNLITNASEAIGNKPGAIEIRTGALDCDADLLAQSHLEGEGVPGTYAFIEVKDSGCGMDEGTQVRMFEPFFTTKFTGRGLGMSVMMGIVRAHEGAILLDSRLGVGSTFRVLIPVGSGPAAASTTRPEEAVAEPSPFSGAVGGKILVVDDEEGVRITCAEFLSELGYETLLAADGVEALEVFRAHPEGIAMVLLDLTMPHLGGKATFEALMRQDSRLRVVITSGHVEADAAIDFPDWKPAAFLQKPFKLAALQDLVERLAGVPHSL